MQIGTQNPAYGLYIFFLDLALLPLKLNSYLFFGGSLIMELSQSLNFGKVEIAIVFIFSKFMDS